MSIKACRKWKCKGGSLEVGAFVGARGNFTHQKRHSILQAHIAYSGPHPACEEEVGLVQDAVCMQGFHRLLCIEHNILTLPMNAFDI